MENLINDEILKRIEIARGSFNEEPCNLRHQSAALNTSVHNNVHSYAYALIYICKSDNWSLQN